MEEPRVVDVVVEEFADVAGEEILLVLLWDERSER